MPLEDLQNLKLALSRLLDSEGWKAFGMVIQGQIRARRVALIETRISRLDDCLEMARLQGELAGLQAVRGLPEAILEEVSIEVERRLNDARGNG